MDRPTSQLTSDWVRYFDRLGSGSPLFAEQARMFAGSLLETIDLAPGERVLDFGCGHGFVAALLAPHVDEVLVWDPSPAMLRVAVRNTASFDNVSVCDLSRGPDPDRHVRDVDLIVVNSVVQYMQQEELARWLPVWREMLTADGELVLSDLIPPDLSRLADGLDLLRMGWSRRSPVAAPRTLATTPPAKRPTPITMAIPLGTIPAAIGRYLFVGWCRSAGASIASLMRYVPLAARENATKANPTRQATSSSCATPAAAGARSEVPDPQDHRIIAALRRTGAYHGLRSGAPVW